MSRWPMAPRPALIEPGRASLGGVAREAEGTGWREALAALEALLSEKKTSRVALMLSSHFVRFLVVPWDASLAAGEEREAYLRHRFGAVYGERVAQWAFSVEASGEGTRLASAVDAALLDEARAAAARQRTRLAAVQPLAVAEYNRARRRLSGENLFFAVLEPRRACAFLVQGASVARVANRLAADPAAELRRIVALESAAAGADGPLPVHRA